MAEKYSAPYLREKTKRGKNGGTIRYWQGILRYKSDDGKWHQVTKIFHASGKKECKKLLLEWQREMNNASSTTEDKRTVEEAVESYLNYQHNSQRLADSTFSSHTYFAKRYIYPYLGSKSFQKLTYQDIEAWENELRLTLAESTVARNHAILLKTYKNAYRKQEIKDNPFDFVESPRPKKRQINYLTLEGKKKLDAAVDLKWQPGTTYYTAIALARYAGLRVSEICGLRWSDVILHKGMEKLKIERVIGLRTNADTNAFTDSYAKEPKTRAGKRTVPLMDILAEALRLRKQQMKKEYDELATDKKCKFDDLYVVGNVEGDFLTTPNLKETFRYFAKKNNILGALNTPITIHGLRHTFATDSVAAGIDIKSLSSILGHEDASMTLNIYASSDEDAKAVAMEKLNAVYNREQNEDIV